MWREIEWEQESNETSSGNEKERQRAGTVFNDSDPSSFPVMVLLLIQWKLHLILVLISMSCLVCLANCLIIFFPLQQQQQQHHHHVWYSKNKAATTTPSTSTTMTTTSSSSLVSGKHRNCTEITILCDGKRARNRIQHRIRRFGPNLCSGYRIK